MTGQVAIGDLDTDHLIPLKQSLQQLLSTQLAELTFAQIVDGLPVEQSDTKWIFGHDPDLSGREAPSDNGFKTVFEWKSVFQVEDLMILSDAAQSFQNTATGTREFHLRLIEMLAISLHTIAAQLFSYTNKPPYKCPRPQEPYVCLFTPSTIPGFSDPPEPMETPELIPSPHPTFLLHMDYRFHDQYPMGISDVVGYWAEYRIFGGVVLFDRGESEEELRDIYFHPNAGYRVFKLSEEQFNQLITFCLRTDDDSSPESSSPCPLPMAAEPQALRIHCDDTFDLHIFRDKYERNRLVIPDDRAGPPRRIRLEDDPGAQAVQQSLNQHFEEQDAKLASKLE